MVEVSVMRFNMCVWNLFYSFTQCKMIVQEADLERKHLPERTEARVLFDFFWN